MFSFLSSGSQFEAKHKLPRTLTTEYSKFFNALFFCANACSYLFCYDNFVRRKHTLISAYKLTFGVSGHPYLKLNILIITHFIWRKYNYADIKYKT